MVKLEQYRDEALRWHAVHVVSQLPENAKEAHKVLDLAREMLDDFVTKSPDGHPQLAVGA